MNESRAIIERIRRINADYQYIELAVDDAAIQKIKPGESLLVRLIDPANESNQWYPYLREQWWPVGFVNENVILVERPFDHRYQPQQIVSVLGPVGQPYRFRKSLRNVLLVAYNTPPTPLTIMISQLLNNKVSVTMVLLGSARDYLADHISPEVEVVRGDNEMDWPDMVMTLGWADQIFVVVGQDDERLRFHEVMEKVKERRVDIPKNYIFGVFQPLLPCGNGACSACLLRVNNDLVPTCTKGPAFDLTTVKLPT
jgi:predicted protein tyrosine phosphatase